LILVGFQWGSKSRRIAAGAVLGKVNKRKPRNEAGVPVSPRIAA